MLTRFICCHSLSATARSLVSKPVWVFLMSDTTREIPNGHRATGFPLLCDVPIAPGVRASTKVAYCWRCSKGWSRMQAGPWELQDLGRRPGETQTVSAKRERPQGIHHRGEGLYRLDRKRRHEHNPEPGPSASSDQLSGAAGWNKDTAYHGSGCVR
jgi:hypothetical protein